MIVAAGAVYVEKCCRDAAAVAAAGPDSAAVVSTPSVAVDPSSSSVDAAAAAAGRAAVDVDDIASVVVAASMHCCQWQLGSDAGSLLQPSNITTTAILYGDSSYLTEYKHLASSTAEFEFE